MNRRTLVVIRHAKSSWQDGSLSDIERPLNHRGLRDAPEMGARLKQRGVIPDFVLCSTAVRVRMTIERLLESMDCDTEPVFTDELYGATDTGLLSAVRQIPEDFRTAFVVAHNPGITHLANRFSLEPIDNVPTCGLIQLRLDSWGKPEAAEFMDFDYPKKPFE